eukprot:CAMPEP_0115321182 /NCGR_PEP_ID=MMETSP0270-20121206/80720_1 /TAXON_ID=71861 /ORGANISM="Scrippsiella trochoidea, Strain CCMP3099" /LENGTH=70 /DNA_ID=CAMNT_0002741039 /DNA_START=82 /DNA_END=295 /DNA_ORIENTATION=-
MVDGVLRIATDVLQDLVQLLAAAKGSLKASRPMDGIGRGLFAGEAGGVSVRFGPTEFLHIIIKAFQRTVL